MTNFSAKQARTPHGTPASDRNFRSSNADTDSCGPLEIKQ